ncbi:DNA polymerase IV [Candidatus Omnitrophota bacterium]
MSATSNRCLPKGMEQRAAKSIMHIDMDAFFASVEQRVNPSLRGKPVIVGGRDNPQASIICAASYEAKRAGVKNAMPSWKAFQICPEAIFVAADSGKYIYISEKIFEILKDFSPKVEKYSVDEFFLDVTGEEQIYGSLEAMGRAIKLAIFKEFGLTCSVGVAPGKIISKLVAKLRKPDGLMVVNKEEALDVLRGLPVEKLCGVGRRLERRFHLLGIETCDQLAEYPQKILKEHFGVVGLWLRQVCRLEDTDFVGYHAHQSAMPKSVGNSQTLKRVSQDPEYIRGWIYLLSEMVAARLRRKKLQGRAVSFYVSDGFGGGFSKCKTFVEATYDGFEIYQRCLRVIHEMALPSLCARVLGVSVSSLLKAETTYLFEGPIKRERLLSSVDKINQKYGTWTIFPASLKKATY